ncbi:MAG: hypothetical protein A2451_03755 [Bdellovibrionales bacterium RIFOXYC2_FULL_39_8]|nr:MAG: hypothetical protein A2451_03755 [Bdellovibrionales bacterium RIFOXYC2_FULL_39_8]
MLSNKTQCFLNNNRGQNNIAIALLISVMVAAGSIFVVKKSSSDLSVIKETLSETNLSDLMKNELTKMATNIQGSAMVSFSDGSAVCASTNATATSVQVNDDKYEFSVECAIQQDVGAEKRDGFLLTGKFNDTDIDGGPVKLFISGAISIGSIVDAAGDGSINNIRPDGVLGASRELKKGFSIYEGDKIITRGNSYAKVILKDESSLLIGGNSYFVFSAARLGEKTVEKRTYFFDLVYGSILASIKHLTETETDLTSPSSFQIMVRSIAMGIRGTDLWASAPYSSDCGEIPVFGKNCLINVGVSDGTIEMSLPAPLVAGVSADIVKIGLEGGMVASIVQKNELTGNSSGTGGAIIPNAKKAVMFFAYSSGRIAGNTPIALAGIDVGNIGAVPENSAELLAVNNLLSSGIEDKLADIEKLVFDRLSSDLSSGGQINLANLAMVKDYMPEIDYGAVVASAKNSAKVITESDAVSVSEEPISGSLITVGRLDNAILYLSKEEQVDFLSKVESSLPGVVDGSYQVGPRWFGVTPSEDTQTWDININTDVDAAVDNAPVDDAVVPSGISPSSGSSDDAAIDKSDGSIGTNSVQDGRGGSGMTRQVRKKSFIDEIIDFGRAVIAILF